MSCGNVCVLCRFAVMMSSMAVVGGNWRFLSAKPDYLWCAFFRSSVCFLDATVLIFSVIVAVEVWKRFSLIDMC